MRKQRFLLFATLLAVLLASNAIGQDNNLTWPTFTKESKPCTRWWWLGSAVDKPNLTYNLEELQKAGIGGVEITPIYGVKGNDSKDIPFLSTKWMEMLNYTITEAQRLGMTVDMNTGTGWPFGGPQISHKDAAGKAIFQNYILKGGQKLKEPVLPLDVKQKGVAALGCLMAYSNKGLKINLTSKVKTDGTLDWIAPDGEWKLIALFNGKTLQAVKRAAPGGEGLVMDHFSNDALPIYLNRFTKAFEESGCPKPSTFFNDSYEVYNADWTPHYLDEFSKQHGYKLEDYFPEFIGQGNQDTIARLKSDYRETMSNMLINNFTKPWTNWAHSMGSINRNQAHGSPGNLIDIYATPDIPECETFGTTAFDIPGLRRDSADVRQGDSDPVMLKFSSSAAHLAGHKYTSSETFTWLGEHFKVALSQCKPELDQLFLSGVNHVFFHGATYSPKEAAWPGWLFYASVEFVPKNNIMKDISGLTQYITRCQSFLQSGQPDNDLLVYWPIYDIWNNPKGMDMPLKIHDQWLQPSEFYAAATWLRKNGYDFDHISDNFLLNATVENGKIKVPGGKYRVLLVPECRFMPLETFKKICALSEEGAKIIFINSLPEDVPGLSSLTANREQFSKLKTSLHTLTLLPESKYWEVGKGEVVVTKLISGMLDKLHIKGEDIVKSGVGYIRRKYDQGNIYFFANQQSKPLSTWVELAVHPKSAAIFDPLTGRSGIAKLREGKEGTEVFLQLAPDESLILKTWDDKEIKDQSWIYYQPSAKPIVIKGPWKLSIPEGSPTIKQDFKLDTLTSWTNLNNPDLKSFSGTGKYVTKFILPEQSAENWQLDLGKVCESARVKINGKDAGIWWSIPFRANVGEYLKKGENVIEIEVINLSANRIADMDRKGTEWRIFKEINFVDVNYKPFSATAWKIMDSGLLGPVTLTPMKQISNAN
jgi:hypothetical protein